MSSLLDEHVTDEKYRKNIRESLTPNLDPSVVRIFMNKKSIKSLEGNENKMHARTARECSVVARLSTFFSVTHRQSQSPRTKEKHVDNIQTQTTSFQQTKQQ